MMSDQEETKQEETKQEEKGFKDSPTILALTAAFDTFSYLKGAYDIWTSIFFPEPSTAELIIQAKEEILAEIRDAVSQYWRDTVGGLINFYRDYTLLHDPGLLDEALGWAEDAMGHLEGIIKNGDDRSASIVAEAYNLLIPLRAIILLQRSGHLQQAGIAQDFAAVQQNILDRFREEIEVNKVLLGPYTFEQLPNIPCYRAVGKLAKWWNYSPSKYDEYTRITEVVWQANERLREATIEGYGDHWFTIEHQGSCLYASRDSFLLSRVTTVPRDDPDVRNRLWKVQYLTHDTAKIVHRSGECLTVGEPHLYQRNLDVRIFPCAGTGCELNYELFVREGDAIQHYWLPWRGDGWRRGASFGQNVQSAPAVFQNAGPGAECNYEVFVQEGDHIQHYWLSPAGGGWRRGASFGQNVQSAPAVFQNRRAESLYNYELFVQEGDHIQHYWLPWRGDGWRLGASFGQNVQSAPAVFQNVRPGSYSNYELFVQEGDHIQHYWLNPAGGGWRLGASFGQNVQSAPAVFQNVRPESYSNFELFVQEDAHIQHYWLNPAGGGWRLGASFGQNVQSAPAVFQNRGAESEYNYELFVPEGDHIQHYWLPWKDGGWRSAAGFGQDVRSAPAIFQNLDFRDGQVWLVRDVGRYGGGWGATPAAIVELGYSFCAPGNDDDYNDNYQLVLSQRGAGFGHICLGQMLEDYVLVFDASDDV
jgi:hypothetical protein